MPAVSSDVLQDQVVRHLAPHGSDGVRAALSGVVDLHALEERRYGAVLTTVDERLVQARYSLLSMLVAGIYFGSLVGHWLVDLSTWTAIAWWVGPLGLVSAYALYSVHQTLRLIRHLSEARSLLEVLHDRMRAEDSAPPA
jgi:hypothetical protein